MIKVFILRLFFTLIKNLVLTFFFLLRPCPGILLHGAIKPLAIDYLNLVQLSNLEVAFFWSIMVSLCHLMAFQYVIDSERTNIIANAIGAILRQLHISKSYQASFLYISHVIISNK